MDDGMLAIIIAPILIFLIFVAPIWLILHYRSKKQVAQGISEEEYVTLLELAERAEKMAERIHTLEAILDSDSPEWRSKV